MDQYLELGSILGNEHESILGTELGWIFGNGLGSILGTGFGSIFGDGLGSILGTELEVEPGARTISSAPLVGKQSL